MCSMVTSKILRIYRIIFFSYKPFLTFAHETDLINFDLCNESTHSLNACTAVINSAPLSILSFSGKKIFPNARYTFMKPVTAIRDEITGFKAERVNYFTRNTLLLIELLSTYLFLFIRKSECYSFFINRLFIYISIYL